MFTKIVKNPLAVARKITLISHATSYPFTTVATVFRGEDTNYKVHSNTVAYLDEHPEVIHSYALCDTVGVVFLPEYPGYTNDLQNHLIACYAKLKAFFGAIPTDEPVLHWASSALIGLKFILEEKNIKALPYKHEASKILQAMLIPFRNLPNKGEFVKLKTEAKNLSDRFKNALKVESTPSLLM